jgi:tetratricopeptide (TPR) repeat protein
MKINWATLTLLAVIGGPLAAQRSEIETGRAYYMHGEFKKAAAQFQLALKTYPENAESYYWMGMSYQRLADIALPFGGGYNGKARLCLTKAMELEPNRSDYRRELFEFLLDPAGGSRSAARQAAAILEMTPESDPDYSEMRRRLQSESKANASAEAKLARVFLALPQAAYRVVELPAAVVSRGREEAQSEKVAQRLPHAGEPYPLGAGNL